MRLRNAVTIIATVAVITVGGLTPSAANAADDTSGEAFDSLVQDAGLSDQAWSPDENLVEAPTGGEPPADTPWSPEGFDPDSQPALAAPGSDPSPVETTSPSKDPAPAETPVPTETPAPNDGTAPPAQDGQGEATPTPTGTAGSGTDRRPRVATVSAPRATGAGNNQGLGDLGYYTFLDFPFFDANNEVAVRVNVGNGNLLVQSNESVIASPGASIDLTRIYNSLNTLSGDISSSWSTNYSKLGVTVNGTTAKVYGKTGEILTFTVVPSSGFGAPTYTPADGVNASLTGSVESGFTLTYNRTGEKLKFTGLGWISSDKDRNGNGVTFGYGGGWNSRTITSITDATGKTVNLSYITNSGVPTVQTITDFTNRTTTMTWGAEGRQRLLTANGFRGNYAMEYDSAGHLTKISSGDKSILFEYGIPNSGAVTKITQKKTGETDVVTSLAHSAGQTVVTDPRGGTVTYAIDNLWRVTSAKDQLNHTRAQTFTPNGDIATTTDATTGNITTNSYDGSNNLTKIQLPTGAAAQAFYAVGTDCPNAQSGNPYSAKCTVDAAGNKTSIEYDTAGNPTKQTDTTAAGGAVTHQYLYASSSVFCWAFAGQICSSTDGNGNTTQYTYDNGNLTKVSPPAPLGGTTYGYDSLSRVTSVKDGNGATTTYGYDDRDRIVTTTYSDSSTFLTAYNGDGTKKSESDSARQVVMTYSYNLLNKTTQQTQTSTTSSYLTDTINYSYDPAGNQTSYSDAGGTVNYTFDAANRLTKLTEPGGACPASGNPAASSGCILFQYDNNNVETARIYPGGARVDTTVDNAGRVTRITSKTNTSAVSTDIGYSYTAAGQTGPTADRTAIQTRTSFKEQGINAGSITTYTYDSLRRLTNAEEKSGTTITASWGYGYDPAGNRTSQTKGGTTLPAASITYGYNAANQLVSSSADTTSWTYDGAGNQIKNGITGVTTSYDSRLAVTSMSDQGAVASFGTGNAVTLTGPESGAKQLTTAAGISSTVSGASTKYYTRTPAGEVVSYRNGTTRQYLVTDLLGSVVGGFTATGAASYRYSYSPYGELRSASSTGDGNSMRYIDSYRFGTGTSELYKLGARYYDPSIGRFTQMDPSGQEKNPYSYGGCNPVNGKDPNGLRLDGLDDTECYILTLVADGIVALGAITAAAGGLLVETVVGSFLIPIGLGIVAGGAIDVLIVDAVCG